MTKAMRQRYLDNRLCTEPITSNDNKPRRFSQFSADFPVSSFECLRRLALCIIKLCFREAKAIWVNTITARMNETQDKLPLRLRKWAVPRGIFLAELCSLHKRETPSLRIILCSMCFSTSANFLQRTMHVMSGMLNKDKSSTIEFRNVELSFILKDRNFSLTPLASELFSNVLDSTRSAETTLAVFS
jgi:hypothetical protein